MQPRAKQSPLQVFYFHPPFEKNFWPDILDEIYKKQVYQRFLPHKKDSLCLDVGANIGLATYYFSQHFDKVYSLEPAGQHYQALCEMIKYNKLTNVITSKVALSNESGSTKFYHNENQTMFSMEKTVNKEDDFEEVVTISLDAYFNQYKIDHIDLMKLDVEGSEGQIVNSEGFKKVAGKIKVIAGEYHQWASCSPENFQHALEELGFDFKWRHDTQAQVFEAVRV